MEQKIGLSHVLTEYLKTAYSLADTALGKLLALQLSSMSDFMGLDNQIGYSFIVSWTDTAGLACMFF